MFLFLVGTAPVDLGPRYDEGGLYPDPEDKVWRIPFCGTCGHYHKLDINGWCSEDSPYYPGTGIRIGYPIAISNG